MGKALSTQLSAISLVGLLLMGCSVRKQPMGAVIPLRCLHQMTVTDFAEKCHEIPGQPNEAVCNGVHVHFACVEYKETR